LIDRGRTNRTVVRLRVHWRAPAAFETVHHHALYNMQTETGRAFVSSRSDKGIEITTRYRRACPSEHCLTCAASGF
jgi:hypothetical protein